MSILKRTGNGIADVAYQEGIKAGDKVFTSAKAWETGTAGGTYNCLHRTGSGIADVAYQSETIGVPLSTYAVGSIVKINESGKLVDFLLLSHGYPASGRTLLLRKDIYDIQPMSIASSDIDIEPYFETTTDAWLNSTYLNMIDTKVRNKITAVNILCRKAANSYDEINVSRKVFLLSITEVLGTYQEGSNIPYFLESSQNRIAYYNGVAYKWWTRSLYQRSNDAYWVLNTNGGQFNQVTESTTTGRRPAFTLPSNIIVNQATGEVIG